MWCFITCCTVVLHDLKFYSEFRSGCLILSLFSFSLLLLDWSFLIRWVNHRRSSTVRKQVKSQQSQIVQPGSWKPNACHSHDWIPWHASCDIMLVLGCVFTYRMVEIVANTHLTSWNYHRLCDLFLLLVRFGLNVDKLFYNSTWHPSRSPYRGLAIPHIHTDAPALG